MAIDPNRYDAALRRGDCWNFVVTWKPNDVSIDLTGYTADFALSWSRQASADTGYIIAAGQITSVPTVSDKITVALTATATKTIPAIAAGSYQLRVTDPTGCKTTIATGTMRVEPDYIDA